jgi:large subunit ribosomal protein L25
MTFQTDAQLQADVRSVTGKKVRFLRRAGMTPGNIYGHNVPSQAVQLKTDVLIRTLRHIPRTALMSISVAGERAPRPVLIRHLQRHPVTDVILHIDFYEVSMTEKMRTAVPVHVIGSTPAVDDFNGVVVQELNTVEVECLPGDLPSALEIDLSKVENVGESLYVRDLAVPEKVSVTVDPDVVVVRVAAPALEVEPEAEAEAEAEEEAAPAEAEQPEEE